MFVILSSTVLLMAAFPLVISDHVNKGCPSGRLKSPEEVSPPLMLKEAVALEILPETHVKDLILYIMLENEKGKELYNLELNASMGIPRENIVTMMDVTAETRNLKVSWPPFLQPQMWTTMYIHLPYQQLFQLSVIPKDKQDVPENYMSHPITFTPLAVSVKLAYSGVTRLKLKVISDTSVQYAVVCDKDYLATSFASAFGIASIVPVWRSWTWILVGLVILQLIVIIILVMKFYMKNKKWSTLFNKAHFQSGSGDGDDLPTVSSQRVTDQNSTVHNRGSVQLPNVSLGVVSSRAPSPGLEIDETTVDYVNQAYTND